MSRLNHLLQQNQAWAKAIRERDPDFFPTLAAEQHPKYLWIGCSDSRVPANQIVGLPPGDVFVHRNIANLVNEADLNCLSVIQFAVEFLQVSDIIVCGHYGCGGVAAAYRGDHAGIVSDWVDQIQRTKQKYADRFAHVSTAREGINLLCELNVREQAHRVCECQIVKAAWNRSQDLAVHGWIYGIEDGVIRDLGMTCSI